MSSNLEGGVKRSFVPLCGNGTKGTSVKNIIIPDPSISVLVLSGEGLRQTTLSHPGSISRGERVRFLQVGKAGAGAPHGDPCGLSPSHLSLGYGTSLIGCLSPERTALQLALDQVLTVLPKSVIVLALREGRF